MSGFVRFWQVLAGFGWFWLGLVGFGVGKSKMNNLLKNAASFGKFWLVLAGFGWFWYKKKIKLTVY